MSSDHQRLRFDRMTPKPVPPLPLGAANPLMLDCYLPLVQTLFEMRTGQQAGVIVAFTSIARGEGVTHVVESLGRKLVEHTRERILLTTLTDLAGAASTPADEAAQRVPQVQRLARTRSVETTPRSPRWEDLQGLRRRFGFVLVDCPAMRTSLSIVNASTACDGAVLVVAAGEARRSDIENAQKILQGSSVKLLGMVLNKHIDPVPGFISKFL
jgi:hypothetical protein